MNKPLTITEASCADDYDPNSMPVAKARAFIHTFLSPVKGTEDSIANPDMKEVVKLASNAKYFQLYYDQALPPAVGQAVLAIVG